MKKIITVALLLLFMGTYAQQGKNEKSEHSKEMRDRKPDFTPEQKAELATKKLTLHLDLSSTQQAQVSKLMLQQAKKRSAFKENTEKKKEMTDTERFEHKSEIMDEKIAFKKEMKTVLTEEQFQKWEEAHQARRKGKKHNARKGRGSRGKR